MKKGRNPRFNCKDVNSPTKKQVEVIKNIMEENNLDYNCTLFDITSKLYNEENYLESKYTNSTLTSYGLNTTDRIKKTFEYIVKNDLLNKNKINN